MLPGPRSDDNKIAKGGSWLVKGDPEGLLTMGYLYNKGVLGGEQPYWYHMAMDYYQKSAAAGNCIAMMDIGGLYYNGNGVAQDRMQSQNWFAKAEACSGPGLEWVREKSAKFREKAAAGRLPTVPPEAIKLSAGQKSAAALLTTLALAIAAEAAKSPARTVDRDGDNTSGGGGVDWQAIVEHDREMEDARRTACIISGGKTSFGCY